MEYYFMAWTTKNLDIEQPPINPEEQGYVLKKGSSKKHPIYFYSCVRRYYNIVEAKTKKVNNKRMWIVIGDGHRRYRKFETQADAIKYFRKLKKFAKMRVQSVNSKEFIKTTPTFLLLQYQGLKIDLEAAEKEQEALVFDDSQNFEDQFSQYDDVEKVAYESVDHAEIDKVIAENEGDVFLGSTQDLAQDLDDQEITYIETTEIPLELQETPVEVATLQEELPVIETPVAKPTEPLITTTTVVYQRYSKYNPSLFEKHESRRPFIITYDALRYLIVLLMFFFAASALWYLSRWQKNALVNLGVNFNIYSADFTNVAKLLSSDVFIEATQFGVSQWVGIAISDQMLTTLAGLAGTGITTGLFALAFKRSTLFSFLSIILTLACLIVVATLFSLFFSQTNNVVQPFRNLRQQAVLKEENVIAALKDIVAKVSGKVLPDPTVPPVPFSPNFFNFTF